jgi:hypothetical protein
MGYDNNGGCCNGGFGFPFGGGFMNGFGGFGFDALILLLFFGLMGGGMWGGLGGWGMGGFGGGAGMLGATSLAATETAALINQQNTADRVAAANAKADAIAGIVTANGTKIETVKDAVTNGFFANQTNMCELGNNIAQQFNAQTLQGINNHNNLTAQLTDMRFANQQCCCDTKQLIQSSFCDLRHQMAADKCETLGAIAASKAEILGVMNAQRMAELEAKNIELKGQISQANQTAAIVAAVQANGCKPACSPSPCSPYPYGFCNPCVDGIQRAVNDALGTRIGEILFPPTTPAAA